MESIPPNGSANTDSGTASISPVCALLSSGDSTDSPPAKRYKPTPSFAKIKVPKTSTFKIFSDEERQRAEVLDNNFIATFEKKCLVGAPVLLKFEGSFPVDIWREILDHACSRNLRLLLSR